MSVSRIRSPAGCARWMAAPGLMCWLWARRLRPGHHTGGSLPDARHRQRMAVDDQDAALLRLRRRPARAGGPLGPRAAGGRRGSLARAWSGVGRISHGIFLARPGLRRALCPDRRRRLHRRVGALLAIGVPITVALAAVSFAWIEAPAIRWASLCRRSPAAAGAGGAAATTINSATRLSVRVVASTHAAPGGCHRRSRLNSASQGEQDHHGDRGRLACRRASERPPLPRSWGRSCGARS